MSGSSGITEERGEKKRAVNRRTFAIRGDDDYVVVFGYRHVQGVPCCPCGDPGNYLSMERSKAKPLRVRFRCWCGRTLDATLDSQDEYDELLSQSGVSS